MITIKSLAALHGIHRDTARMRLKRAGIAPVKKGNVYYFPRQQAIAASASRPAYIPQGAITLRDLAEIAGVYKNAIAYRLKKAGITPIGKIVRKGAGKGCAGGRPMLLYPQREAIYAALK